MSEASRWVRQKMEQGHTEKELVDYMLSHGYSKSEVKDAFDKVGHPKRKKEKPPKEPGEKKQMSTRNFILLMALIVLIGLGVLLFIAESRTGFLSGLFS